MRKFAFFFIHSFFFCFVPHIVCLPSSFHLTFGLLSVPDALRPHPVSPFCFQRYKLMSYNLHSFIKSFLLHSGIHTINFISLFSPSFVIHEVFKLCSLSFVFIVILTFHFYAKFLQTCVYDICLSTFVTPNFYRHTFNCRNKNCVMKRRNSTVIINPSL